MLVADADDNLVVVAFLELLALALACAVAFAFVGLAFFLAAVGRLALAELLVLRLLVFLLPFEVLDLICLCLCQFLPFTHLIARWRLARQYVRGGMD